MISRPITFEVEGLRISGQFYLPQTHQPSYPAVCVCHGIPRPVSEANSEVSDGGYPQLAERICREGFAVLIFNFRGTGDSDGNFDILGWTHDLRSAIDYLWALPEVDRSRLCLLGFSAGAAVSIYVAAQDKRVSAIAACASPAEFNSLFNELGKESSALGYFRSLGIIRDENFPDSPEEWLGNFERVSPVKYIAEIAPRPLLLVHGSQDEVVSVSHAYKLYAEAGEPKNIVIFSGAGHRLRRESRAVAIIIDWLKSQGGVGA